MSVLNKKVLIAIVSYNSRFKLPDCLAAVFHQHYAPGLFEVAVFDNNSSDNTVEYLKEAWPSVQIICSDKNLGFAGANNRLYQLAKNKNVDYLVLLNDDTIVSDSWLMRLIATAESDDKIGAVQAKLLLYPEKNLINSFGNSLHFLGFAFCNFYRHQDNLPETMPFKVPYPSGATCAIKMPALKKIGLFDEDFFMYHEDVDLGWRLRLIGYDILLDPLSVVYHKYNYSKAKYKFYHMECNRLATMIKNYKLLTLIILSPIFVFMKLGLLWFAFRNGWLKEKISGWFWVIKNLPSLWQEHVKIQRLRKVKDREILSLMVGRIDSEELNSPLLTYVANPLLAFYFRLVGWVVFW